MKSITKPAVNPASPTVFIVDDDEAVREALSNLIRSVGLRVEAFASATEFLSRPEPDTPACLVLDVRLPGLSGMALQVELASARNHIPIIFISGYGDIPMTVRAMKAGAIDFIAKPFRDQDLLDAIEHAIEKDAKALKDRSVIAELRSRFESLTPREREVMGLVIRGLLNKQVAAELGTSEVTVKIQRGQMMKKMKVTSVAELVRISQKLGLSE
jgi:FixJ family two-component response regulator